MVARVPLKADRRSLLVRLTARGLNVAVDLRNELLRSSAFGLTIEEMATGERAELNRLLRQLNFMLDRRLTSQAANGQK